MAASDYFESVQKLYLGYYGREADAGGLAYWATRANQVGGDLSSIINEFANSNEANTLYGGLSNLARIEKIYQQIFQRPPDSDGAKFYASKLDDGTYTPGTLVFAIIQGARDEDLSDLNAKLNTAMSKIDQNVTDSFLEKFWLDEILNKDYGGLRINAELLKDDWSALLGGYQERAFTYLDSPKVQAAAVAKIGQSTLYMLADPHNHWLAPTSGWNWEDNDVEVPIGRYVAEFNADEYMSYLLLCSTNQFAAALEPLIERNYYRDDVSDAEWQEVVHSFDDQVLQLIGQYGLSPELLLAD